MWPLQGTRSSNILQSMFEGHSFHPSVHRLTNGTIPIRPAFFLALAQGITEEQLAAGTIFSTL